MTIQGVHIVRAARVGKPLRWYIYAWRSGPKIRVAQQPGRPTLTREDIAAIAAAHAADRTLPPELVAGAVAAFRRSRYWRELADNTRRVWGHALDRIEGKWAEVPMRVLSDLRMKPKIVQWRDSMDRAPRTADIAVTVLRTLLDWAVLEGLAGANPAAGIPTIYRATDRAPVIWLPEDIAALGQGALPALRDAVALAELTGLRRADLVALRWDEIGDLAIHRTAAKRTRGRRYRVTIPKLPQLAALLETLRSRPRKPDVETVLVNSFGQSWSGNGLASSFHDARKKANGGSGIWHSERDPHTGETTRIAKRLHDLRGTFATRLMTHPSARLTDREISDLMGWSESQVSEIRKRYVDDAAIVVAIATRLAEPPVKRPVKRR